MFPIAYRFLLVAALAAAPALAQKTIGGFTAPGQRSDSAHLVGLLENNRLVQPLGAAFVSYVPAKWKAEFNDQAKVDALTSGHLFRLGLNNWATLDNLVPMTFGNVTIPVGIWYLGVARDTSGSKWTLVFVDPAKCKAAGIWPPMADNAPRTFEVPLPVEKAATVVETMEVSLNKDEKEAAKGTFRIVFGNLKASVNYELKIPAAHYAGSKDASSKKN
jgi:hypothetical protein